MDVQRQGIIPRDSDGIRSIAVKKGEEEIPIDTGTEADKILALVRTIADLDPDLIFTDGGDSFLFPYLVKRAQANGIGERLCLGREEGSPLELPSRPGTSFFSYGQIHYKSSAMKLRGRVHIDISNSFVCNEAGLDGFFELSRLCRLPLHTSSRASIGRALSSLQFYNAHKQGLLIPWKPTLAEHVKDRLELLVADRGGFTFEPRLGVYENVAEFDFSSLYPNIMLTKNISGETVRCDCCPDSKNRVPELDWNICQSHTGIIPRAMKMIVGKRRTYKRLRDDPTRSPEERARYDARQAALKWIGVTSFGYLGFNNAKFGRIDAHIAVCAWDRRILLDATRVAEAKGFRVIHGIVDSLWVKKERADEQDYAALRDEIQARTGFDLSSRASTSGSRSCPRRSTPAFPS